jgi:hypothetical protein
VAALFPLEDTGTEYQEHAIMVVMRGEGKGRILAPCAASFGGLIIVVHLGCSPTRFYQSVGWSVVRRVVVALFVLFCFVLLCCVVLCCGTDMCNVVIPILLMFLLIF